MKLTKQQLRKIIRENIGLSGQDIKNYLISQAQSYWNDKALIQNAPGSIRELLQDDFLDNFGHVTSIQKYTELIDKLSQSPMNGDSSLENQFREGKIRITCTQLRRIIKKELLREWQYGMDRDPSGQEVRDQVGAYQSTFNPDNYGWNDEAWDAARAAGPTALAKWLVGDKKMYDHLFLGGIWAGIAKYLKFDPEEVRAEGLKLDPKAFENWE